MAKKISEIHPFGLRIPEDLKAQLDSAVKISKRSLNSEMIARLAASFEPPADLSKVPDGELVAELMRRYERGSIYIRIGGRIDEDTEV